MTLINTPEGAVLKVESGLDDAADSTASMMVTVHQVDDFSVGNVWICVHGGWYRVIDEWKSQNPPAATMLMGLLSRLSMRKGLVIDQDPRLSLAVRALVTEAKAMVENEMTGESK